MKVLMIEDNESVTEMMSMFFEKEKFDATFIHDGLEGFNVYKEAPELWDIVILDLNLPSMDGMVICAKIREISDATPIIMLTARDTESEQVIGLEMGADDYVTKPFSPMTLLARMKALHRRSQISAQDSQETDSRAFDVMTDKVKINTLTREAYYNNEEINDLTPKEFELLVQFAKHPRRVFTRDELLTSLWEDPFYGDERTVDAHIKKLRQKIEKHGDQLIQTVWGVGYKFDESGDKE